MNQILIVKRDSTDENTFAVVEFAGCPASELLKRLKAALSEWRKTPEGKEASEFASGDFNIGDLANFTPAGRGMVNNDRRGSLNALLVKYGVEYLDIDVYSDGGGFNPQNWTFDTVLMK
jgi:hypothetical protein